MIYSVLLIALCLLVSSVGAWTDIKTGRVKNIYLLIAFGVGLIIYVFIVVTQGAEWIDFSRWAINLSLSIVLSVVFYLSDVWAPGDAKLFILVAALYPVRYYAAESSTLFPALTVVVFAYATGYIYLIIVALRGLKSDKPEIHIPSINRLFIRGFVFNAGMIIGFQRLISALFPDSFEANQILVLLCIVGICYEVQRRWPKLLPVAGIIGLCISAIITGITKESAMLFLTLPLSVVVALLTQVLIGMADSNNYREITGEEVRPGMILSFGSILAMQKCIDPNIPRQTTENRRSRLNASQADAVRNWCHITKQPITIVEMLPFAPFICIGLIIEIIRHFALY